VARSATYLRCVVEGMAALRGAAATHSASLYSVTSLLHIHIHTQTHTLTPVQIHSYELYHTRNYLVLKYVEHTDTFRGTPTDTRRAHNFNAKNELAKLFYVDKVFTNKNAHKLLSIHNKTFKFRTIR